MKTKLIPILAVLLACTANLFAEVRPIVAAQNHLGRARSILSNLELGGPNKKKQNIPGAIGELSMAESKIIEAKNNKGSHSTVALKLIAEAKTELQSAKSGEGDRSQHLEKAGKAVDEAMKRVKLAIGVN